jgi:hypothetical protein
VTRIYARRRRGLSCVSSPSGRPQLAAVARLAALTQRMPLLPGSDEHVFGHRIAAAARYTGRPSTAPRPERQDRQPRAAAPGPVAADHPALDSKSPIHGFRLGLLAVDLSLASSLPHQSCTPAYQSRIRRQGRDPLAAYYDMMAEQFSMQESRHNLVSACTSLRRRVETDSWRWTPPLTLRCGKGRGSVSTRRKGVQSHPPSKPVVPPRAKSGRRTSRLCSRSYSFTLPHLTTNSMKVAGTRIPAWSCGQGVGRQVGIGSKKDCLRE